MSEPVSRSSRTFAEWVVRVGLTLLVVLAVGMVWQRDSLLRGGAAALGALGLGRYGELPENIAAMRCRSAMTESDFREAEPECRRALSIDPTHACRRELAEILLRTGRTAEAEAEIERHLKQHDCDGLGGVLRVEISIALGRPKDEIAKRAEDVKDKVAAYRTEVLNLKGEPGPDERAKHARRLARLDAELLALERAIAAQRR